MIRLGLMAVLVGAGAALLGCSAAPRPASEQVSRMTAPDTARAAREGLAKIKQDDAAIAQAFRDGGTGRLRSLGQKLNADAETAEEYVPPGYSRSQRVTYWTSLADQVIAGYDLHRGDAADAAAYLRAAASLARPLGLAGHAGGR